MPKKKKNILKKIIKIELEMFENVRTSQPSLCQENPVTFKLMREMNHSALSISVLKSYLEDLKTAKSKGRNLMTEKYARMNNLIPALKLNPLIQKIVSVESDWMNELSNRYPSSVNHKTEYFTRYLSCELETYSDRSIDLYVKDIELAKISGISLAKERFDHLIKKLGYSSLEEFESKREL